MESGDSLQSRNALRRYLYECEPRRRRRRSNLLRRHESRGFNHWEAWKRTFSFSISISAFNSLMKVFLIVWRRGNVWIREFWVLVVWLFGWVAFWLRSGKIHGFRITLNWRYLKVSPCRLLWSLLSESSSSFPGSYQLLLIFLHFLQIFALCFRSEHCFFEFCEFCEVEGFF